eukprot:1284286-Pyramimonas_sp.AAC.1
MGCVADVKGVVADGKGCFVHVEGGGPDARAFVRRFYDTNGKWQNAPRLVTSVTRNSSIAFR